MSEKKPAVRRRLPPKGPAARPSGIGQGEGTLKKTQVTRRGIRPREARGPGASEARQAAPREVDYSRCAIKKECGSCLYVNEPYKPGLQAKHEAGIKVLRDQQVLHDARILKPVASPRELAYRSIAKLAVRPGKGPEEKFSIGLFEPGTHQVVDVSSCPVHMPVINRCVRALIRLLGDSGLKAWDEKELSGHLRYLIVRASHLTQELSLTFVCPDEGPAHELRNIIRKLQENFSIHGAYINCNPEAGNQIFGSKTKKIMGGEKLRERLLDLRFEISPASFFQVNPWQASNLYRRVGDLAGAAVPGAVAWDLYAGVGPISLVLARNGYRVVSIEENPDAVRDAGHHGKINALSEQIHLMEGRVEAVQGQIPRWGQHPQVVVANPSRRGMAPETRDYLKKLLSTTSNMQLLYVSCDVNTLARDLAHLQESGRKLRQVESFDMFAQTDKLEWLAVIT